MTTNHDQALVGFAEAPLQIASQYSSRGLVEKQSGWLGLKWCREFHRQYHEKENLSDSKLKVRCACCDRKFIRERHVGYLVG